MLQLRPGHSPVHRVHPLVKLAWLLWITIAVFVFDSTSLPLMVASCAIALLWVSGIAPWRLPGVRLWLGLSAAILVTQALAISDGDPVLGPVTTEGLIAGVRAAGRLLSVILMSALFVSTTDPVSLTCTLMRLGLPDRWGFALVVALRLVPVFRLEAHHIYRAQLVRGVAYDGAGPRRWWVLLRRICLPLLVSTVRTAHWLSLSMEGRAFGLHRRRTFVREVPATRYDAALAILLLATIVFSAWWGSA